MHSMIHKLPWLPPLCLVLALAGCPSADSLWHDWDGGAADRSAALGDTLPGLISMAITPANTTVTQGLGETQKVTFVVTGTFANGPKDVTKYAQLSLKNTDLGVLDGARFTSAKNRGGKTLVEAYIGSKKASTSLVVKLQVRTMATGAPAASDKVFGAACTGSGQIKLSYPPEGTLLPPNLADLTVMWTDSSKSNLWELAATSESADIRIYTASPSYRFLSTLWYALADSNMDSKLSLSVRGVVSDGKGGATGCTASQSRAVSIGPEAIKGGLYYWSASPVSSFVRFDFGTLKDPTTDPEPEEYYTDKQAGDCVGCHAISPDGTRIAFSFSSDYGGILDVRTRTLTTAKNVFKAKFQTFSPDNKHLITSYLGTLTLRDGLSGTQISVLNTGAKSTHPELSSDGKQLVFVVPEVFRTDSDFDGGSIYTAQLQGTQLGAISLLVAGKKPTSNYYPSFSPDGKWVLFNRSSSDSYSDEDAQLWVVRSTGGNPVELKQANRGQNLRNSWARWSPFLQISQSGSLFWFTFSSTRDYGTLLANEKNPFDLRIPQIWMAAFDSVLMESGKDPSFPAFWLPYQKMNDNNHIAQWTKNVLKVD